jgi:hypothetical protein
MFQLSKENAGAWKALDTGAGFELKRSRPECQEPYEKRTKRATRKSFVLMKDKGAKVGYVALFDPRWRFGLPLTRAKGPKVGTLRFSTHPSPDRQLVLVRSKAEPHPTRLFSGQNIFSFEND